MMMNTPDDNLYRDLLKAYAAPTGDAGFTDGVMRTLAEQQSHTQAGDQIKPYILALAIITGGGIAALQIPKLVNLVKKVPVSSLPAPNLPESAVLGSGWITQLSANLTNLPDWGVVGLAMLILVIFTTLADQTVR